ncbi:MULTISPECIES: hypothetical protein [unclassified Halomonas]|uniref:hypothetical protein n=1 Tax=unclassified Halomonas TaxID=2609666 RepID=UPI003CF5085F
MRIELRPLESGTPGEGRLLLKGWKGETTSLQLSIQESQDQQFLHPEKTWSTKAHSFELASLEETDDQRLQVVLDSTIIDPLLELPGSTQYLLALQDTQGTQAKGVIRLSRDLMPSSAAGSAPSTGGSSALYSPPVAEKAPEPEVKVEPEPEAEPEVGSEPAQVPEVEVPPAPASKASKRGPWLFLLLGLVLLAAVAFGAWYWFSNNAGNAGSEPVEQETVEEEESNEAEGSPVEEDADLPTEEASEEEVADSSAGSAPVCSIAALEEQEELAFVQGCSKADVAPEALLSVIEAARDAEHCGIARRLYANRAIAGDATIALAYAREYDPAYHQASTCFTAADAETASYWYQIVLDTDPDNSEAQARFEELGE